MRRGLALVLAAFVALSGCSGLVPSGGPDTTTHPTTVTGGSSYSVTVTTVVDGDTIHVRFQNGTTDTVRLLGVDTPETHAANTPDEFEGVPDTDAGRACLRDAGHDATRFSTRRLLGERVHIHTDPAADGRGYYGRILAYVTHDGRNINYRLVATGHARVYDSTFTQSDRFYDAEQRAQANGTGLWQCASHPQHLADGGSGLTVATVHADADGDDRQNLNDEYVVLANEGESTVDLSGWTVNDTAGATYTFPQGVDLAPGAKVTLRTGDGTNRDGTVFWDHGRPIWNNDGDTVTVRAANGTVVAQRSYG